MLRRHQNFLSIIVLLVASSFAVTGCGSGSTTQGSNNNGGGGSVTPQGLPTFSATSLAITSPYSLGQSYYAQAGITVSNATSGVITVVSVATSGSADFTQSNNCGGTLAAGTSCLVTITFKPAQGVSPESGMLTFTSGNTPITATPITLSGTETAGAMLTSYDNCAPDDANGNPVGNCVQAFADAIAAAGQFFNGCKHNSSTSPYTLSIPAGIFDLSAEMTAETNPVQPLTLDGVWACNTWLIEGAGSSLTTILTNNIVQVIHATGVNDTTIQGLTFGRNDAFGFHGLSITQGVVKSVASDGTSFVVDIQSGFPSPAQIHTWYGTTTNYIKPYTNLPPAPPQVYNTAVTGRLSFASQQAPVCTGTSPVECTIYLDTKSVMTPAQATIYMSPNMIACFKMEASASYYFNDVGGTTGSNVGFNDIVWKDSARGAIRGINNAFITNSAIRRRAPINGQPLCVAAWAGGPQIGQPTDPTITGLLINNFASDGTADEDIEVFNSDSPTSQLSNITIGNGFGNWLVLFQSCHLSYSWANLKPTLTNCSQYQNDGTPVVPTSYGGCIFDSSPTECSPPIDQNPAHQ